MVALANPHFDCMVVLAVLVKILAVRRTCKARVRADVARHDFRPCAQPHLLNAEGHEPTAASTVRFYRDHLENHVLPLLGSQLLSTIGRRDVKRLLVELRGKGLRPTTITGIVRTLSTILSEAMEDEKLPANPALRPGRLRRGLRDPNRAQKPHIDPYSRDEAALLVETATRWFPEWHAFLLCALRTGLRLGELRARSARRCPAGGNQRQPSGNHAGF
jgi:integrase